MILEINPNIPGKLDFQDHQKVWEISIELNLKSIEYAKVRMEYAEAKFKFDILLATNLPILRQKKPNIGIETAQIMILEDASKDTLETYKELIIKENYYKGLEKIIDALKSQITLCQSLIKNQTQQGA